MHDLGELSGSLSERYRIERELGRGGMATVYLAHDRQHDRKVAVKVLRAELAATIGPERFLREIAITARLDHPHILPLLDSGKLLVDDPERGEGSQTLLYYVMPLVDGESLRQRLDRERQLPVAEAIRIAREVAGALSYAHAHGVIHRDIKPENILLASDHARVADFGIARAVASNDSQRLTETGFALGTPAYMSPEQATGDKVDARTDIYALGCVLYEMIAGERPFDGPTPHAIVARVLSETPRSLAVIRPGLPGSLESVIRRATARVPADRFSSAGELDSALARVPDPGYQTVEVEPVAAPQLRKMIRVAVIGIVMAGLLVAGFLLKGDRKLPAAQVAPPAPEVVALYQRGVRGYERRTTAGINDAITSFTAATRLDSTFSRAWSGLAKAYVRAHGRRFEVPGVSWDSVLRLAVVAAEAALVTDSTSADAWLAQAQVNRAIDPTDMDRGIRAARRALTLDSTLAPAWHELAIGQADRGELDAAMDNWRRSVAVNPAYTQSLAFMAMAHYWRRQYDSAAKWADSTITVDPTFLLGRSTSGYIAIEQGDFARAGAAFDAAQRIGTGVEDLESLSGMAVVEASAGHSAAARALLKQTEDSAAAYLPPPLHLVVYRAHAYAALGDVGRAVGWLSRYQPRSDLHFQHHLHCDPPFDPIANDSRFRALWIGPPKC